MIRIRQKGDFSKTEKYLKNLKAWGPEKVLEKYGRQGVVALASATPVDSGLTASSWGYRIENQNGTVKLIFYNTNVQKNVNIAIILQLGHGTRNGGYVQGRDYINPAIRPVFERIKDEAVREVRNL